MSRQWARSAIQKSISRLHFCSDSPEKKKYDSKPFPEWDPLPYKLGAFTTTVLIVLFSVVFSDGVLNNIFGLDPESTTPMGGMCTVDDMDAKIKTIETRLIDTSNLAGAIGQTQAFTYFLEALQNDTALWGEKGHECSCENATAFDNDSCWIDNATFGETFDKTEFLENGKFGMTEFGNSTEYGKAYGHSFFPGVCEVAQKLALQIAREQTCMVEFCNVGLVIDPNTTDITSGEIVGKAELEQMIDEALELLKKLRVECNGQKCDGSAGSFLGGALDFAGSGGPDFDIKGKKKLKKQMKAIAEAILELSVSPPSVEWGYTNKEFCGKHEVPCPDYTAFDVASDIVNDYRVVKSNINPGLSTPDMPEAPEVDEVYAGILELLLSQMEIASYLYTAYKCLSLFFPAPQIVFRVNFAHSIRQYIFGLGKYKFLVTVLTIWWLGQYLSTFVVSVPVLDKFQLYMKLIVQEPCITNQDYLADVGARVSTVCNTLVAEHSEWNVSSITIHNELELIPLMEGCCTKYPDVSMTSFNEAYKYNPKEMDEYGFELVGNSGDFLFANGQGYRPTEDVEFIGNFTACNDDNFIRREVLQLSEVSDISWWNIWVSSGVLASFLLSPVVANYGIALAQLADPLMQCNGMYEGPPSGFSFLESEVQYLMKEIHTSLAYSAFGQVMISGILLNLLMLNVILGKMDATGGAGIETEDAIVAGVIFTISIITFVVASKADRILSRRLLLFENEMEELESKTSTNRDGDV